MISPEPDLCSFQEMWPGHCLGVALIVLGHSIFATLMSWFFYGFYLLHGLLLLLLCWFFFSHFKIFLPKSEKKEKWRNQRVLNNSQRLQGCLFPACNYLFLLFTPDSFLRAWNHFRITCPTTTECCTLRRSLMLRWLEDSVSEPSGALRSFHSETSLSSQEAAN